MHSLVAFLPMLCIGPAELKLFSLYIAKIDSYRHPEFLLSALTELTRLRRTAIKLSLS